MATDYNRQYIGARYVPQFFKNPDGSWDWTQGFQYEPLTIVKYGENTYTSKMLVPATVGSPNLNPGYWANTGNYNGFITDLNNRLTETTTISAQNAKDINLLINKRVICISDSYGSVNNSWINLLQSKLDLTDTDFYGYAEPGGGFGKKGNTGYTFQELLMSHSNDIENADTITHIIVLGGTNDYFYFSNENTLKLAINNFMAYCKNTYQNAKVYLSMVGNIKYKTSLNYSNLITVSKLYENAIKNNGVYMSGLQYIMHDPHNMIDAMHPSEDGSELLSTGIISYLNGGDYTYISPIYELDVTQPPNTSLFQLDYSSGIIFQICGEITSFIIPAVQVSYSTQVSLNKIPNIPVMLFNDTQMLFPNGEIYYEMIDGFIDDKASKLTLLSNYISTDTTASPTQPNGRILIGKGYKADSTGTNFVLPQITLSVPTLSL